MATQSLKLRKNPINIAPLVDILLVLFVILVVAARFDNETAIIRESNITKPINDAEFKKMAEKLTRLEKENMKLRGASKTEEKQRVSMVAEAQKQPVVKKIAAKQEDKNIAEELAETKKLLREALSGNLSFEIEIYNSSAYVNQNPVTMDELKLIFDKAKPSGYHVTYQKTEQAKARATELKQFLQNKGYKDLK
jgi:biopolymer transport protein ExbD